MGTHGPTELTLAVVAAEVLDAARAGNVDPLGAVTEADAVRADIAFVLSAHTLETS